MNVMRVALAVSVAWTGVAVLSALLMQAELAMQGISVFVLEGQPAPALYIGVTQIHTNAVHSALPATLLGAVGCAQLARRHPAGSLLANGLNMSGLVLVVLGTVGAASKVLDPLDPFGPWAEAEAVGIALAGVSVLVALMACFRDREARRASAAWLFFALTLVGLTGWPASLMATDPDARFQETYMMTALWHGVGGVAVFLALGLLCVVARGYRKRLDGRVSAVLAGMIALSWAVMVIEQARLGLAGMPSQYLDYANAFSAAQARASLAAFLAAGLCLLAVLRLAVAPRAPEMAHPVSVF